MAGGFPVGAQWSAIQANATTTSSGLILTSSATTNTVGPYVELISSTARSSTWLSVQLRTTVSSNGHSVEGVNIAIGASGSEVVVIPDLVVTRASISSQEGGGSIYLLPLIVPAGSRVSANVQSSGASITVRCAVMLFDDAFGSGIGGGAVNVYGYSAATSIGTQVDPGGTSNTKGAWTEITPSLTYDIAGFFLAFDGGAVSPASSVIVGIDLDIGVGTSGSEVVIFPDWQMVITCTSSDRRDINPATTPFFPMPIPAGTRIAARAAANSTIAIPRVVGVTVYGVRA